MKLVNITKILSIGVIAMVMAGCGGGSGASTPSEGGSNPPPANEQPPVTTSPFDTVQEVFDGETLSVGTYSSPGTNYFDYIMPLKGNLVVDSIYSVFLYDENMNYIDDIAFTSQEGIELEAGKYIIKYETGSYNYTFTLNSDVKYNQYDLPLIENGTYDETGVVYYRINMQSTGKVFADSQHSLYLYDMDLNYLGVLTDNRDGVELEAGDYVVKYVTGGGSGASTYPFTLYSDIWD